MDREVGEEFFSGFYGKSYKVINSKGTCTGCAFNTGIGCRAVYKEAGNCRSHRRSDNKNVIFEEVYRSK